MDSNKSPKSRRSLWIEITFWLIVAALLIGGSIGYYAFIESKFGEPKSAGTFGDMFGLLGALISGLAFAAVLAALRLQKRQAQEQQEQIQKQLEYLKHNQFEETYFRLLEFHQKIVSQLEEKDHDTEGRALLKDLFEDLRELLIQSESESKEEVYSGFIAEYSTPLGTYFRSLRYIVKFLADAKISEERTYSNMLRSQMSSEEAALLYYNMCHRDTLDDTIFRQHVQRFNLLKVLKNSTLISSSHREEINEFIKISEEYERQSLVEAPTV